MTDPGEPTRGQLDDAIWKAIKDAPQGSWTADKATQQVMLVVWPLIERLRAEIERLTSELAKARRDTNTAADIWVEQLAKKTGEWATEYDRAHVATRQADQWKAEAERLAAMGRAVQTDRDEQRIRADTAEAERDGLLEQQATIREIATIMLEQFTDYTNDRHAYMVSRPVGATVINAWRMALGVAATNHSPAAEVRYDTAPWGADESPLISAACADWNDHAECELGPSCGCDCHLAAEANPSPAASLDDYAVGGLSDADVERLTQAVAPSPAKEPIE